MNTVIFGLQIFAAAGLSVWLWIMRPWLSEHGWQKTYFWATSGAISSAAVAVFSVPDLLAGKDAPSAGIFLVGIIVAAMIVTMLRNVWYWIAEKAGVAVGGVSKDHIRGASLADERTVAKQLKHTPSRFSVGAVPVPVELETRGFLLAGTPGTGKSQTLTHCLDALRADGALAVIADESGIYCERYYDEQRGDVILNPFDARCVSWSPLCELASAAGIPSLAKSLVPDGEGSASEWNGYAQTFTEAVLEHCLTAGLGNGELFRLLVVADLEELREVCAGTPAMPLVAVGNERMFGSIRGIASSAAKFLQYLDPAADAQNGFSIRRYIRAERPGYLFLTYEDEYFSAVKSMIACAVDVASRTVLSLPPSRDRRVVFGLDELSSLGKIQSIVSLAEKGRKRGAVIFAGLQTIAQLRQAYGHDTSQTFLSCLGSWLVLRTPDPETAEYMSRYIGEEEKTRELKSTGTSHQGMQVVGNKSNNLQEQVVTSRVVMPSELQALPDLRGIFNLAGPTPAAVVNLRIAEARTEAEALIAAPPRVRVKPQVQAQPQKQAGGTSRDAAADDLL